MDIDLTDLFAERQKWRDGCIFKRNRPRKSNGFVFLNGCSGEYTDKYGKSFPAPCKSLVYLPYQSEYSVLNVSSSMDSPDAYLIEFNIVTNGSKITLSDSPIRMKNVNQFYVKDIMEDIVSEYESLNRSPSVIKQLIYKFIVYLCKEEMSSQTENYSLISPAIDFLEKNSINSLTVDQLAAMCHISSGYFRKLFNEYAGKSPMRYITDRKIDIAKKMLDDSNTSISMIAELLEFSNSSYFCKMFKKRTGLTPNEYRNTD